MCLSICLLVGLSVYQFAFMSVHACVSVGISVDCQHIYIYIRLPVCTFLPLCICLSVRLFPLVCLFVVYICMFVCQCVSMSLSFHLSMSVPLSGCLQSMSIYLFFLSVCINVCVCMSLFVRLSVFVHLSDWTMYVCSSV